MTQSLLAAFQSLYTLHDVSPDQLNDSISLFVFEVKNKDGSEYPANSVHGLACSIQRYQNNGYCVQLKMHYNTRVIKI